jgi:hypothetical protein
MSSAMSETCMRKEKARKHSRKNKRSFEQIVKHPVLFSGKCTIKMLVLPKLTYRCNSIPTKITLS